MTDLGPLNFENPALPLVQIDQINPLRGESRGRQPILVNLPRARQSLANKYSGYFRELQGQYPPHIVNAMIAYDADRVRRGQSPLSENETRLALEAARTGEPQTKPPKKSLSPLALPGNVISNLGDIVKAIPRLPAALIEEGESIRDFNKYVSEAPNPLAGVLRAPGVRMLPLAYTAGNIAAGEPGEIVRNPLFTVLDVLPAASTVAKGTRVATRARELTQAIKTGEAPATMREAFVAERLSRRPISTSLMNTLDGEGNIIRNAAGEFIDEATKSRALRPFQQWFSRPERDVMYAVNAAQQRVHNIVTGYQAPAGQLDELSRDAYRLREDLAALDPELPSRIPDITARMKRGQMDGLSDADLAGFEMYRDLLHRVTDWKVKNNHAVLYDGEVFDLPTGTRLRSLEVRLREREALNAIRQQIVTGVGKGVAGAITDPAQAASGLLTTLRDQLVAPSRQPTVGSARAAQNVASTLGDLDAGAVRGRVKSAYRLGVFRALEGSGYDISYLHAMEKANPDGGLVAAIDEVLAGRQVLPKTELMNIEQVMQYIADNAKGYKGTALATLRRGLAKGEWKVVSQALQSIRKQTSIPALSDPVFIESVRQIRENAKLLDGKFAGYSDKAVSRSRKTLNRARDESVPARFIPEVERRTKLRVKEQLEDNQLIPVNTIEEAQRIAELADSGMWSEIPGFSEEMYRKVQREVARDWRRWRNEGFDPVWVHTVTPNRINKVLYPTETVIPTTPISTRARTWDAAPGAVDFSIAMADDMRDFLSKREVEVALRQVIDLRGETEASLRARFAGLAEDRARRSPVLDREGHLQQIIAERYRPFDPDVEGYNWGSPYLKKLAAERPFIPIETYNNLKDIANPKAILGGVMDPATKLFRMSVVGTSIRTQIYNILGGAVAVELQRPGAMIRNWKTVRDWIRDPSLVPDELKEMIGSQKRTMLELDDIERGKVTEGVARYMKGAKLRQWWDQIQQAKVDKGLTGQPIRKFAGKVEGLVQKAYDFNGFFDDMYRMTAYLDEYNRGIKAGYTHKAAAQQGIGLARRVLQDWMGMTPMERGIMKSIFPFYGFIGHAMRFVLSYPMDHPLRAEFMTKLAMAEIEDLEGLPTRFLGNLFLGGLDAQGKRNSLNIAPFNPFGDVANMMSVGGFLGATNPLISTAFQMVGVDQGTAELYPSLRYDPETGRLAAKHGNPLFMLAENTIPQTALISAALGLNDQFNEMLTRDPAAANRFLLSTLTVPLVWRNIEYTEEQFKAEVARQDAQTMVKNEALRSGDWDEASRYPSLASYLAALDAMPDDLLSPFRPITDEDTRELARRALSGENVELPRVPMLDEVVNGYLGTSVSGGLGGVAPLPGSSVANTTGGT